MSVSYKMSRTLLLVSLVVGVSGCTATKLRDHNIQLESLLNTRADAREKVRQAQANGSLSLLEEERRLTQTFEDLASLAADAAADVDNVSENETKVSYLFTAARAGSKTPGPVLAKAFKDRVAEGKKKDAETKEAGKEKGEVAILGPTIADDDPVSPFYFGIVVPGRTICGAFKDKWERPARDCAFLSVVAYFVAVDEVVAQAQELETMRAGKNPVPDNLVEKYHSAIEGLYQQFRNINAESAVIENSYQVSGSFKTYLDTQMFRTFCSAHQIKVVLNPGGGAANQLKPAQAEFVAKMLKVIQPKLADTLKAYATSGGYDCGKAPAS